MGSASSKAAKATANGASKRKYPTRIPPSATSSPVTSNVPHTTQPPAGQPTAPGPTVHPHPSASYTKDASITLDASDPDFAASLRSLGPVQPSSTMSNSSTFSSQPAPSRSAAGSKTSPSSPYPGVFPDQSKNPALRVLEARERIAEAAEREFAVSRTGRGGEGRRFIDVGTIREALVLRDGRGMAGGEIEKKLGLKAGVMGMLAGVGEGRMGRVDREDSGIY